MRYELVKVNIVRADLRSDKRHIYPHRVIYFDADSHGMMAEDAYDSKKEMMHYRELPLMNFYDEPACLAIHSATYSFGLDVTYLIMLGHLKSKRLSGEPKNHMILRCLLQMD